MKRTGQGSNGNQGKFFSGINARKGLENLQELDVVHSVPANVHGYLDYAVGGTYLLAPSVMKLNGAASSLSYFYGGSLTLTSLLTDYPLGAVKVIPFPLHGAMELVMGLVSIAAPWIAGFDDNEEATYLFVSAGLSIVSLWAFTDYYGKKHPFPEQREGVFDGEDTADDEQEELLEAIEFIDEMDGESVSRSNVKSMSDGRRKNRGRSGKGRTTGRSGGGRHSGGTHRRAS